MLRSLIIFAATLIASTSLAQPRGATDPYLAEEQGYFTNLQISSLGVVATDNYASTLYLIHNGNLEKLYSSPGCGRYYTLSPDKKTIGFKLIKPDGMQIPAVMDITTKRITELHAPTQLCGQVSFGDNGEIAYTVGSILYIQKGGALETFNLGTYSNICPISPDGSTAVFSNSNGQLAFIDLSTGSIHELSSKQDNYTYPRWSPDSKKLLFTTGEFLGVWNSISNTEYTLAKGVSGSWSDDSHWIVYQRTQTGNNRLTSSDIYQSSWDGQVTNQLTNTNNVYEMGPTFDGNSAIVYHTYSDRSIVSMPLQLQNGKSSGPQILIEQKQGLPIQYFDVTQFYSHGSNNQQGIVHLPGNFPYVHQKYDTPDWHIGSGSCAPTASIMAIAHYNRVPRWERANTKLYPHTNDFGSYVADKYRFNEYYYDHYEQPYGSDSWGGYGYMWGTVSSPYNGGVRTYLEKHGITSNQIYHGSNSFQLSATEIDLGYPHIICAMLTSAGHIPMAVGYIQGQQTLIFMEPYGNKNTPGWPSYDGIDVYYDWPGQNNGYQNLDANGQYGIVAWTCHARADEVTYNDTIIDDLSFEHGFYMHNKTPSHQRYYRDDTTGAYKNHAWWTLTENTVDICYVTWTPNLPNPGMYEVSAYIPTSNANATTAQYKVHYDGDSSIVVIDQNAYSGQWVSLGTFPFVQGQVGYVYMGDASGNSGEQLAFDAVQFNYRGIRANPLVANITCNGDVDGSIVLSPTNGIAPYTYTWTPAVGSSSDSAAYGLTAGSYFIKIYDAVGDSGYALSTVVEPDTIAMNPNITKPSVVGGSDGSIVLSVTGGTLPYSYLWNTGNTATSLQNLSAGTYAVTVSDTNACTDSAMIIVEDPICVLPYDLLASNITSFGADLSWVGIDAIFFVVQYKRASDTVWTEVTTTTATYNLSGLASATDYNWRVTSVCVIDTSAWADSTFTTLALNSGSTILCTGKFADSGGENGEHGNNESYTYTIAPAGATAITMIFNDFELETSYDSLYIYDGLTTSAPLIGGYSSIGSPGVVNSLSGALTFSFYSDISTVKSGWIADWYAWGGSCDTPPTTVVDSTINWQTNNFSASFTDVDNSSFGLRDSFYSVWDFNGLEWRANAQNGFYHDDFDSLVHTDWVNFNGTWAIDSNALEQSDEVSTNTNLYARINQDSLSAYLYHWKMKIGGAGTNKRAGVHVFCDDSTATERGNSYLVWFKPDAAQIQLWDNINNIDYLMRNESYPVLEEIWYDIKLLYNPITGELTLFMDDVLITTWTDPAPIKSGSFISLRSRQANTSFDDFRVYRSRNTAVNLSVGTGPSNDIRFQNPNPATPSGRINTLVRDEVYHISQTGSEDINVDWTPPAIVQTVNDGFGTDIDTVITQSELTACWTASSDTNSDIKTYWYAVGTTPGANDVVYWIDNGVDTTITVSGLLQLTDGVTYYFSVIAENNAGLFSDTTVSDGQFARIIPESVFDATVETICAGDTVQFTNNSQNATSYQWQFQGADIDSSAAFEPSVIYSAAGTFEVTLIASGTGGIDTLLKTNYITVNPYPISLAGANDSTLDMGFPTALFTNASVNSTTYYWDFDDGDNSVDIEPYHTYLDTGIYDVMLVASNGLCENDTSWFTIRIEPAVGVGEYALNTEIAVVPNPAHGRTTIQYISDINTTTTIQLYNGIGELVNESIHKTDHTGDQFIELNLANLARGVYLLKIQTAKGASIHKLVIE